MLTEGDLTLSSEYTKQHTGDVLDSCTAETYIILLTNVIPINSIEKEKNLSSPKFFKLSNWKVHLSLPQTVLFQSLVFFSHRSNQDVRPVFQLVIQAYTYRLCNDNMCYVPSTCIFRRYVNSK